MPKTNSRVIIILKKVGVMSMIRIFTEYDKYKKETIILDNDAYFDENVVTCTFDDLEKEILKKIDNAEIVDANIGTIRTPRGIGTSEDLSTGCKTVLNYIYLYKNKSNDIQAVDISQCGANALEVLFSTMEKINYSVDLVLRHKDELFKCGEREYLINDKKKIRNLLYL